MMRKLVIAAVLLIATTASATDKQHWVIYYSDSTWTTPVGKKFIPSIDDSCDAPYDEFHQMGSETVYIYRQLLDNCATSGGTVYCTANGSQVTCPTNVWPDDWWELGEDW